MSLLLATVYKCKVKADYIHYIHTKKFATAVEILKHKKDQCLVEVREPIMRCNLSSDIK